jgi:kynurenine formamidase
MKLTLTLGEYRVKTEEAINISMAVLGKYAFTGFGIDSANRKVLLRPSEDSRGCSCDWINFCPHVHGTHVETAAHIDLRGKSTLSHLDKVSPLLLARLVDCSGISPSGMISLSDDLERDVDIQALIIRTNWLHSILTNQQRSTEGMSPFIPDDVVGWLYERFPCIKVLLIDSLSVDPQKDEGRLLAHRAFFRQNHDGDYPPRFIVELCNIPKDLPASRYALALNAAAIDTDGIPCRPVIYPITQM